MTAIADKPTDQPEVPAAEPGTLRFVAVRANLMPVEIIAGRRTDVLRRRVITGLAGLVATLVLLYGFSWWQTHGADSDLETAQQEQTTLQSQTQRYAPLVSAKADTSAIQTQLKNLMAGDLSWRTMLTTLRSNAPSGVTLTQIGGTVQAGAGGATGTGSVDTGYQALNQTGQAPIGTLTITGTARDKRAVADYADALSKLKGLASPFVSNVSTAEGATTFTLSVLVTSAALGGRYATAPSTSTGGK